MSKRTTVHERAKTLMSLPTYWHCDTGFLQILHHGLLAHSSFTRRCGSVFWATARLIQGKSFDSPSDLIELINRSAGRNPDRATARIQGSSAEACKLDQVACWKEWVAQCGIKVMGMRRVHYLRICLRQDIGAETLNNVAEVEDFPRGCGAAPDPNDIFLVTKRWLHDVPVQRVIGLVTAFQAKTNESRHGSASRDSAPQVHFLPGHQEFENDGSQMPTVGRTLGKSSTLLAGLGLWNPSPASTA